MQFVDFKNSLLQDLKSDKKRNCLKSIETNDKLIQEFLNNKAHYEYVKEFVNDLYSNLNKIQNLSLVEKVLKSPSLALVFDDFKSRDVLLQVCQTSNDELASWLINIGVNYNVSDENGITPLMHAIHHNLRKTIDLLLSKDDKNYLNLSDNNGNSALFHSVGTEYFKTFLETNGINVSQVNNDGRNILMALVETNKHEDLEKLMKTYPKLDVNQKSNNNETLVTIFIKQYYAHLQSENSKKYLIYKELGKMLKVLVNIGCDFNVTIDGDGNTPIMFFLLVEDYASANFIHNSVIRTERNIDLSVKNKYGVNASYLTLFINDKLFKKVKTTMLFSIKDMKKSFKCNKTFDTTILENCGNDIVIRKNHEMLSYYKPSPYNTKVQEWMHDTIYYINPDHSDATLTRGYGLLSIFNIF